MFLNSIRFQWRIEEISDLLTVNRRPQIDPASYYLRLDENIIIKSRSSADQDKKGGIFFIDIMP